jgi:hypothetical protein
MKPVSARRRAAVWGGAPTSNRLVSPDLEATPYPSRIERLVGRPVIGRIVLRPTGAPQPPEEEMMSFIVRQTPVRVATAALTVGVLFLAATVDAAGTPAQKCQAAKNKEAGKYTACRENAEAKLAASGDTTKYGEAITKCSDKFTTAWQKHEDKAVAAGSACPSVGDATGIGGKVTATTDTVAALVGGMRFEDNGDGTVTDHETGRQWEQKVSPGGGATDPHDVDNTYTWHTASSDLLAKLNGADDGTCFVSKCDWRLPTIEELQTILLAPYPCGTSPCIDAVFGPTVANWYWSATTPATSPPNAYGVYFANGQVNHDFGGKNYNVYVRAVRGGS